MSPTMASNSRPPEKRIHPLSLRVYRFLLLAYPLSFRREYAPHMAHLFRDCYRAEKRNRGPLGVCHLILRTLLDLARTAPKEHLENLGKDNSVMNTLRKDALALIGCLGIIVVAFFLLSYGRKHEVPSILIFGYALDALVTAGIVGNLIVFVLVKTTRLNPLRTALWVLLIVNGVLLGCHCDHQQSRRSSFQAGKRGDWVYRELSLLVCLALDLVEERQAVRSE